ncbi:MAG TPA: glycosyltransferase [Edaphocola sp.]|nr:glycosyltransferase [Edaphocola sp.]
MKVLQIINSLYTGGAEKLLIDIVPLFQEKGIDCDVLSLKNEKTPFWEILKLKSKGEIIGLTKGSVYNPLLIFKIIPFLKKYDIIHVHLFPAFYWVVLAKWISFSKTKIIYTEHSTTNRRVNNFLLRNIDKVIYKDLNKIITISDKVDENIKKYLNKLPKKNFKLILNGVNVSNFLKAKPYPKSDFFSKDDFILIQVAGFRIEKDHTTLIRSLIHLPSNIKLLLVGEGSLKIENEDLVRTLGLEDRVKFLGIRMDIPQLLKTADIIILSTHYEGLSLSCIEGMAVKPFIGSNVPGLKEIVKDYGLLFEHENDKELASLILKLANDPVYYKQIAQRCVERAKEFDIEKMINSHESVYKEVIDIEN